MTVRKSLNVLFVCSMNQWRSPTAEKVYADKQFVNARSAGTNAKARRTVRGTDLSWADIVFVMEQKHLRRLSSQYPGEMKFKEVYVLDIPDNYRYMDVDLIDEIAAAVDPILKNREDQG